MDSSHLVKANASAMREAAPANPLEFGPVVPQLQPWLPPQESALREYLRVLIKRKWTVFGVLATIFSLVAIASFKMTPIYEAVGRIAINRPIRIWSISKTPPTLRQTIPILPTWIPRSRSCKVTCSPCR